MKGQSFLVFYDSWCPLCLKAKTKIEKADKQKKIIWISFRDKDIFEKYNLAGKQVEQRIYSMDLHKGKTYSGINTILEIMKRIRKYRIFVPFLYVSIILGFGPMVYDYIAKKRKIVPVGHCENNNCSVNFKYPKSQ
jgi:predicted DCC family thiol-disulfide oxidoreductase YuxK